MNPVNPGIIAAIAYGLLVLIGGIVGYAKAKSKPSLISGVISGTLLILSGLLQWQGIGIGRWLAIAVTTGLIVVFTIRTIKTRKFMPSGVVLFAGVIALVMMVNSL